MNRLIPLLLLLPSCSAVSFRQGLIDPGLGLQVIPDTHGLSALHTSVQATQELYSSDLFQITAGAGPAMLEPLDGRSAMYGGEITIRATVKTPHVQPYLESTHGMLFHTSPWEGSDVDYEFTNILGLGLSVPVTPKLKIEASYNWFHASNGKTFFGDRTRQFFGLTKADQNEGYEAGSIFIGVSYDI